MTIDQTRAFDTFKLFADLNDQAADNWRPLVGGACARLSAQLREGADTARHQEELCLAASACAYGDYLILTGGGSNVNELRVGEISIKNGAQSKLAIRDADEIRSHFLAEVAHLLKAPPIALLLAVGDDA